ncbi:MAG: DegT/DnrJ/EryC1/StrS family aminotransferase, partial [Armatimonadota bacterium]
MSRLALHGGSPARTLELPTWPVCDAREEEALLSVLRSGQWGRLSGTFVRSVEERFADYVGTSRAIAFNSGHTALRMALLALDPEPGAEVILPPYTFVASGAAIVSANLTPVFADIDAGSFCLDPRAVEAAITPRTRAIMPVHLGGQIADMDAILDIAKARNLKVVEDCAQAIGATWEWRPLGGVGDIGCVSFYPTK